MSWLTIDYGTRLRFEYTNWRNETEVRNVVFSGLNHGSNEWYPEPQWFIHCWDPSRQSYRSFALDKIEPESLVINPPL